MDVKKKIQAHKLSHKQNTPSSESQREIKTEQRKFPRTELSCPVELVSDAAQKQNAPAQSRTDNTSNGGCYLTLPPSSTLSPGSLVNLILKIPRQTPNTYLLESLRKQAKIVRIEPARQNISCKSTRKQKNEIGLALEFSDPCELSLE
ncbi:MAG: PilZ domain-containing protein [Planctomycetes bacterium]|nr:PilZ domain-containing protein [Planctomycetota bacterium]